MEATNLYGGYQENVAVKTGGVLMGWHITESSSMAYHRVAWHGLIAEGMEWDKLYGAEWNTMNWMDWNQRCE